MADWHNEARAHSRSSVVASATSTAGMEEVSNQTAIIAAKLKDIYKKSVLPVEKKYRYDFFFESPLLTDVEFDGASFSQSSSILRNN